MKTAEQLPEEHAGHIGVLAGSCKRANAINPCKDKHSCASSACRGASSCATAGYAGHEADLQLNVIALYLFHARHSCSSPILGPVCSSRSCVTRSGCLRRSRSVHYMPRTVCCAGRAMSLPEVEICSSQGLVVSLECCYSSEMAQMPHSRDSTR